jgi:hypothetical protein
MCFYSFEGRRVRVRMVVGFTSCARIQLRRGVLEQHYVIKFVSDLRQVCGFLRVLQFPPSIKLTVPRYS